MATVGLVKPPPPRFFKKTWLILPAIILVIAIIVFSLHAKGRGKMHYLDNRLDFLHTRHSQETRRIDAEIANLKFQIDSIMNNACKPRLDSYDPHQIRNFVQDIYGMVSDLAKSQNNLENQQSMLESQLGKERLARERLELEVMELRASLSLYQRKIDWLTEKTKIQQEMINKLNQDSYHSFQGWELEAGVPAQGTTRELKEPAISPGEKVEKIAEGSVKEEKGSEKIQTGASKGPEEKNEGSKAKAWVKGSLESAKEGYFKIKQYVSENFSKVAQKMKDSSKGGFKRVKDYVGEKAPKVAETIKSNVKESYQTIKDYVKENAPRVASKLEGPAKDVIENVKSFGEKSKEVASKLGTGIKHQADKMKKKAKELSESLFNMFRR